MGDTIPPGETNIATEGGQHFGFPWFGGGQTRTNEYKDDTPPSGIVHPVMEHDAHAADMGAVFYTGKMFLEAYQEGYFWAQHGSWKELILLVLELCGYQLKMDNLLVIQSHLLRVG